ncbi:hypothetical protein [uncultured Eubacterium sp.]|uniref:hypothetical protein n=1 Tax=uncultured Eubacterium sp. TaxID=165185 RepID=UPI0015B01060|nr:hypothetical protein [uncultured Eubacterium sp.]
MPFYDIAQLRVEIIEPKGRTEKQAIPYLSKNQDENIKANIVINVDDSRVEAAIKEHPELNQGDWEYMLTGSDFYTDLIKFNGILLHSSCVVVDGVAYAFSADSGTGKSTHTQLWLKHFGDRAYILNDDKPAIRIIDGKPYACGTPWSGKYDYSTPAVVPLAGICFLSRSETNQIKKADTGKAIYNIFSQTVRRLGEARMNMLMDNLNEIFKLVPIYDLGCNMSDDAVLCSYNAMKKEMSDFE